MGLFASPAYAVTSECTFSDPSYACQTGNIVANSTYHAVAATATAYASPVTCYVYDRITQAEVGIVRDDNKGLSTTIVIRGLYGTYWMNCVSSGAQRYASGALSNDSWKVD
ncbi:hypothetical protein [Plantactinospora sp. WMMB782]|uniref:hypothetical protein n=1 Tax=Plantactinospora sp. WMMB782 TaxID=3404121 RepID=UPI003B93A1E0